MAQRCGCPDCQELKSGCGVNVDYDRIDGCDIYEFSFDGTCVAGDGLWWDAANNRLNVKLRPDGGLSFDGNGALQLTDRPDCRDRATVAALEGRKYHQDVVIGALGAGFQYKPQTTFRSYNYAVDSSLGAVHVPVRMLRDGTPAVTPETHMTAQNGAPDPANPTPPYAEVQVQHPEVWRRTDRIKIADPDDGDMRRGWFGYKDIEREDALPVLSDVLRIIKDRAVLFLHLMWPPVNPDGTAWVVNPQDPNTPTTMPPDARVEAFLRQVRNLIDYHGLQRSTVIMSTPEVPTEDPEQQRDVLTPFARAGVTVAPYLTTEAETSRYPVTDPRWDEWGWIVMGTWETAGDPPQLQRVPPERMKPYTNAGKYGVWYQLTRHTEHRQQTAASGALGGFSTDPAYTSGGLPVNKHCADCGDTSYREPEPDWSTGFIKHGILAPAEDAYWNDSNGNSQASPIVRGAMLPQQDITPGAPAIPRGEYILGRGSETSAGGPTFFVLQGYLELPNPNSYRLRFWIDAHRDRGLIDGIVDLVLAREVRAEVAFAMPHDQRFTDFPSAADKHGYVLSFSTFKRNIGGVLPGLRWHQRLALWTWDESANDGRGGNVKLAEWDGSEWVAGYVGVEIHVNDERIWVAPVHRDTWQTITDFEPYDSSTDTANGHLGRADSGNRGRSVYFGRAVGPEAVVEGDTEEARFAHWTTTPGEQVPPPYPPPAFTELPGPAPEPEPQFPTQDAQQPEGAQPPPDDRTFWGRVKDAFDGDPNT